MIPLNTPVKLITPLNVYDNGAVPPPPTRVTVAVPPLHSIAVVTTTYPVRSDGWVIVTGSEVDAQPLASVTITEYKPASKPI